MVRRWLITLVLFWPVCAVATVPAESEVLEVPAALQQLLRTEVIDQTRHPEQRLQRLVAFMFEPWGLGLTYDNSHSRTIGQTFRDRRGNCLSFTLSFVELARLAGLDARMQEAEMGQVSTPDDQTMVYTGHVNALVKLGRRDRTVDFDRNRALSAGRFNPVSNKRALAHYYNNRGAELMLGDDATLADAHFDRAIQRDSSMVAAHSNRGVLHLRLGNPARGLRHLNAALFLDPEEVSTLTNLIALHRSSGNAAQLADVERRLRNLRGDDPYRHFVIALQLQQVEAHDQALSWFEKAVRFDREQPLFLLGMARSMHALGKDDQADRVRQRARALERRLSREEQRILVPSFYEGGRLRTW